MRILIFVILFQIHRAVSYNYNVSENLSCCPSGFLLYYDTHAQIDECKDIKNTTESLRLSCKNISIVTKFDVLSKSEIAFKQDYETVIVNYERACIGIVQNNSEIRELAIICDIDSDTELMEPSYLGYCMAVSAVFLAVTTLIYSVLHELRDLHGKSIINLCGSLAIGLLILSTMKLTSHLDVDFCAASFFVYFFVIATYFWTTAMAIQVFFSVRKPVLTDRGWRDLIWYTIFAWGSPTVLTIIVAIVNYVQDEPRILKTGHGMDNCVFFATNYQLWKYMYSIMIIILAVDISIFIYVSKILWQTSFASSHVKTLKFKFLLTVRMTTLVGLPWVFEMISSFMVYSIIRVIINVLITLQGPLVFLLLIVFRKKAVKAMYKRGWLRCMRSSVEEFLSYGDDEDEDVQHTEVPIDERQVRS